MTSDRKRLRVAFVPGTTPDKWAARWREQVRGVRLELVPVTDDRQVAVLVEGEADMCLARLPVDKDEHGLHVVAVYDEVPVVVVPKDHPATAYDAVTLADLAGEQLIQDPSEVPGWADLDTPERLAWPAMSVADAIEVVASGTGIVIVPMSLARLNHRKDVAQVPVTDGPVSSVALIWRREDDDEMTQHFVGVVRGRTSRSSR